MSDNYGYWSYNGVCGLQGAQSTQEVLDDGRVVTVKDPNNPAVLSDSIILYAISHVREARSDLIRLFPTLDSESQERLTTLFEEHPRSTGLVMSDQSFFDAIQLKAVTQGVRTRLNRMMRRFS